MKINLNKVTNKWLWIYLLDKYKTNCTNLNNNICFGVDKKVWIGDINTNKVFAVGRRSVIDYLNKNHIDLDI